MILVKEFFKINELELDLWPKSNEPSAVLSNSGILEDTETEGIENGPQSTSLAANNLSEATAKGLVSLTESMKGAKSLLEESKDPLGINDSLYQYTLDIMFLIHSFS